MMSDNRPTATNMIMITVNHVGTVAIAVLVVPSALYAVPFTGAKVVFDCRFAIRMIPTTTTIARMTREMTPSDNRSSANTPRLLFIEGIFALMFAKSTFVFTARSCASVFA